MTWLTAGELMRVQGGEGADQTSSSGAQQGQVPALALAIMKEQWAASNLLTDMERWPCRRCRDSARQRWPIRKVGHIDSYVSRAHRLEMGASHNMHRKFVTTSMYTVCITGLELSIPDEECCCPTCLEPYCPGQSPDHLTFRHPMDSACSCTAVAPLVCWTQITQQSRRSADTASIWRASTRCAALQSVHGGLSAWNLKVVLRRLVTCPEGTPYFCSGWSAARHAQCAAGTWNSTSCCEAASAFLPPGRIFVSTVPR